MSRLSLVEALALVPDPRKRRGRRHPLVAVLSLTVVAVLAGMKSLEAIAQFGRDHGPPLGSRPGLPPRQDAGQVHAVGAVPRPGRGSFRAGGAGLAARPTGRGRLLANHRPGRQDPQGQSRRRRARRSLAQRLRPGGGRGPGPTARQQQDQRTQGRTAAVAHPAAGGQGGHRRRHVHAPGCGRGDPPGGRGLCAHGQGQPTPPARADPRRVG
jgi:DDE_Tnp_1-associated